MGHIVKRPLKEGVGEKPTTPRPLPGGTFSRALAGDKPITARPKPQTAFPKDKKKP